MIAVDFKPAHLDLVEDLNVEEHEVTKEQLLQVYEAITPADKMVTFIDDGRVVAISCVKYLWESVAECFNVRLKHLKPRHLRFIRKTLHEQAVFYDRVQTHSRGGMWEKWHKLMGFHKEATLVKYKDGKDYGLWVIINGC